MRIAWLSVVVVLAAPAWAQPAKRVSAREQISRLEQELADQRALMLRMLELQASCNEQLMKLAKGEAAEAPVAVVTPPPAAPAPVTVTPAVEETREAAPRPSRAKTPSTAEVTGRVHVGTGGPAWVFVSDVTGPGGGGAVEIRQQDKQFHPRVLAVAPGTKVSFPNLDVVYHNVFSLTPGQSFDLGMVRAGDAVKTRSFTKPGVVEIFCNLHSQMSASVLVTPGPLLAKVGADGRFTLPGVPLGSHTLTAWAGGQQLATKTVEVGAGGATADFSLAGVASARPHLNKLGQPYGSYDD